MAEFGKRTEIRRLPRLLPAHPRVADAWDSALGRRDLSGRLCLGQARPSTRGFSVPPSRPSVGTRDGKSKPLRRRTRRSSGSAPTSSCGKDGGPRNWRGNSTRRLPAWRRAREPV